MEVSQSPFNLSFIKLASLIFYQLVLVYFICQYLIQIAIQTLKNSF